MRIVLDLQSCQTSGSRNRGIGRYSMSLAQEMARQAAGHDLLVALNGCFPDTIESVRKAFDGLLPRENIVVFDLPGPFNRHDPASFWRSRAAENIRDAFLSSLAPDIVHTTSLFEGWGDDAITQSSRSLASFSNAITLYDLIPLLYKETYLGDPSARAFYFHKLSGLKNAELLLSISEHSRKEAIAALQLPDDQVVNISSAVDSFFHPRQLSIEEAASLRKRHNLSKPFVMYTGGIDYRKNLDGLIEAFSLLPASIRSAYQLAIVCKINDTDLQRLQSVASRLGFSKHDVVFTGFVTEDDLVALYNMTSLFVFPSLHEGFGLPVLEAMSCGVPVIGANTSSIPEVIGREDALFNPRNPQEIADKIHLALTDEGLRESLKAHGLRQAKEFSWQSSAKRALSAFEHLHETRQSSRTVVSQSGDRRPRLAFFSPLPPQKSGIADYSADLLPELGRYYRIDVIADQPEISDVWVSANFPVRSVEWFEAHAAEFDRILYHFGNSDFHKHMYGLLERHPGVVVMHDFFLSGAIEYLDAIGYLPDAFPQALYHSHGYKGIADLVKSYRGNIVGAYPLNKSVLDQALGVISHSEYSRRLASEWYGAGSVNDWQSIPLLKGVPLASDRDAIRQRMNIKSTDFIVCSFGMVAPTKLNDRLLDAWLKSPLATDERCHLVFVGDGSYPHYGPALADAIKASGCGERVRVTGFVSADEYRSYLSAADVAVQLRTQSRGETSAAILDCLAFGLPTIINANGSASELPGDVLVRLDDEFTQEMLCQALTDVWKNADLRSTLSLRATQYVRASHHPARVGRLYRDAIEHFAENSSNASQQRLVHSLRSIESPVAPTEQDMLRAAASIAFNRGCTTPGTKQFIVDVSPLMQPGAEAASVAAARNVLLAMLNQAPDGYRLETAYKSEEQWMYARRFTMGLLGAADFRIDDAPVQFREGDVVLTLSHAAGDIVPDQGTLALLQQRNIRMAGVAIEVLQQASPAAGIGAEAMDWLKSAVGTEGNLICLTRKPVRTDTFPSNTLAAARVRQLARRDLGFRESDIVIFCLDSADAIRNNTQLLDAWQSLGLANDERYHLVLAGNAHRTDSTGLRLTPASSNGDSPRIHWLGDVANQLHNRYVVSADMAFKSGADDTGTACSSVLACLGNDIPVFQPSGAGVCGPDSLGRNLLTLRDGFPVTEMHDVVDMQDTGGESRITHIYRNVIDHSSAINLKSGPAPSAQPDAATAPRPDALQAASPVRDGRDTRPQMLVDVSFMVKHNLKSGIQRVVLNILSVLLKSPPAGHQVVPVYDAGGYYVYARRFAAQILGATHDTAEETPIQVAPNDVFLGLDLYPDGVQQNQAFFKDLRNHGIKIYFVVFDLLPVLLPALFPQDAQRNFVKWVDTIAEVSDGLLCISRTVADDLIAYIRKEHADRAAPLSIGYFHLGADLASRDDARVNRAADPAHARPAFLMVGTVEPRKGYVQALAAFEELWEQGLDV
ncbi:glycosyltransferase, partial [Noviherbaspirillum sp.]|uniref:glycosyltransferase n=1 Tax=Noviherbaspirillum sp. TaxID=1926288 RepID=UPI002FE1C8BF